MRRKNAVAINTNATSDAGPSSPTSTGAMDSLLEKLRAAAPQVRDQRDRRRRARLKDRAQTRVASGQTGPESGDGAADKATGMLSPESLSGDSPTAGAEPTSESEDVAERAASMLQGLRGDGSDLGLAAAPSNGVKVRRRRESADVERRARRSRRGATNSVGGASEVIGTEDGTAKTKEEDAIPEEESGTEEGTGQATEPSPENAEEEVTEMPQLTTVVSPPSPDGSEKDAEMDD